MKLNSIKNVFGIKTAKSVMPAAKETVATVTKPVAKQASGAEALANQGRAMVRRPYQKPEARVIEVETKNMVATSGDMEGGLPGMTNRRDIGSSESGIWGENQLSNSPWD